MGGVFPPQKSFGEKRFAPAMAMAIGRPVNEFSRPKGSWRVASCEAHLRKRATSCHSKAMPMLSCFLCFPTSSTIINV